MENILALLLFFHFLFISTLNWFQALYKKYTRTKKYKIEMDQILMDIDFHEKAVLREFFIHSSKSLDMPIDDPTVAGMISKGILVYLSSMGQMSREGLMMPLSINSLFDKKLTYRILSLPNLADNPSQEEIKKVINLRPHWAKKKTERLSNRWY